MSALWDGTPFESSVTPSRKKAFRLEARRGVTLLTPNALTTNVELCVCFDKANLWNQIFEHPHYAPVLCDCMTL